MGQLAAQAAPPARSLQLQLGVIGGKGVLEALEGLLPVLAVVQVAQGRVGDGYAVSGVDGDQGVLAGGRQLLVGSDDQGLVVDHGVMLARGLDHEVLEPVRGARGPVLARQEGLHVVLESLVVQVLGGQGLVLAGQGGQEG